MATFFPWATNLFSTTELFEEEKWIFHTFLNFACVDVLS